MPSSGCAADPPWSAPSGNRPNSFHCNYIMQGSIGGVHYLLLWLFRHLPIEKGLAVKWDAFGALAYVHVAAAA